ncbi:hypothetical protein D4764_20G0008270 [Takifugu flavidus]|uniref:Uncharacterized protein n=1 Tax=Takifugu flavidus TaxID=433684 RepID=A0A5C6NIR0_9TELE|nr:hypothetical protein D4764_20G0008270 [Takifugu flavidus]
MCFSGGNPPQSAAGERGEEGLNHKLLVIEEEFERKLEEEKQRFNKEKEAMRQQLFLKEEKFKKLLDEEQILEKESMKQQLLAKEENFNKMLADVCQRWESTAQKWAQKKEELKHKFQEGQSLRQHEEEKNKEELQRLSEAILQLELQVSKRQKNKSFWIWKFWKKMKQTTIPELPKPSLSSSSTSGLHQFYFTV